MPGKWCNFSDEKFHHRRPANSDEEEHTVQPKQGAFSIHNLYTDHLHERRTSYLPWLLYIFKQKSRDVKVHSVRWRVISGSYSKCCIHGTWIKKKKKNDVYLKHWHRIWSPFRRQCWLPHRHKGQNQRVKRCWFPSYVPAPEPAGFLRLSQEIHPSARWVRVEDDQLPHTPAPEFCWPPLSSPQVHLHLQQ